MLQLGPGEESSLEEMLDSNFEPAVLQRGKQLFRHSAFNRTRETGLPGSGNELLALFQHD